MHTALQTAPILAAEKSHVPFYIAGGVLVAWALIIAMAVGMRNVDFPATDGLQRAVMGVTVLLVAATLVAAVATSGTPAKTEEAGAAGLASPKNGETEPSTTPQPETTKTTGEGQPSATTQTTNTTGKESRARRPARRPRPPRRPPRRRRSRSKPTPAASSPTTRRP